VFWCWLFDKYSWKKITLILNTTQILCVVLIILVKDKYFYIFLVILIYFSYGANFGLYPTQTVKIYGDADGSRIYPIIFIAFSLASVIQFLFHYWIVKRMGKWDLIQVMMDFFCVSLFLEYSFWSLKCYWSRLISVTRTKMINKHYMRKGNHKKSDWRKIIIKKKIWPSNSNTVRMNDYFTFYANQLHYKRNHFTQSTKLIILKKSFQLIKEHPNHDPTQNLIPHSSLWTPPQVRTFHR
jgi:MFS family permease